MHGEPSWSYLYRKMIPLLVDAGHRVIAPDLVGFGRSDKPTEMTDYTYARHVAWMQALLDRPPRSHRRDASSARTGEASSGCACVTANPDRFARIVVGNTGLPTGDGPVSDAFMAWQKFSQETPVFDIGFLLDAATVTKLHRGRDRRLRRSLPRRLVQGGCPDLPVARADPSRRSRQLPTTAPRGRCWRRGTSR